MFRFGWLALLTLTLVGALAGCAPSPLETRPFSDVSVATISPSPTNSPTLMLRPTTSTTVVPTITPLPTLLSLSSTWSRYTYYHAHEKNSPDVSIDYPAGWDVEITDYDQDPNELPWAEFHPPHDPSEGGLLFRIFKYEELLHPFGPPDQGKCPIAWYRPLSIPDAQGFMVLTCPEPNFTQLLSYYYSEKYKLQINISMPPYTVGAAILQSPSITDTISQQYGVYEHMVESVRLTAP
ncbi:MAG: hypothetical protein HC875_34100 [Anaerolineales bacterium]|nr:hypothetical protein [Anaerolineales bacterium]